MRFLVTGANGFVGSALVAALRQRSADDVVAATRRGAAGEVAVGDLGPDTDWSAALAGVDVVIHSAARVHVMNDTAASARDEYMRSNVDGTLALARQAIGAGVKRFVYVSSIKANGEGTPLGRPYAASDAPNPQDPYGESKVVAEQGLRALSEETGLEVVIVRPPLVYGPGVRANFAALMRLVARGIPLPLGSIENRRSMVALDNLVDLIITCAVHPAAPGHVFLVSDGEDISTSDLLRRLGRALGRPARLLPIPPGLLALGAAILGRHAVATRVLGSLQVDIGSTRQTLGWSPPISVDEGLRRAVQPLLRS